MRKNLLLSAAILLALSSQAFAGGTSGGVNGDRGQPAGANAANPVTQLPLPPAIDTDAKGAKLPAEELASPAGSSAVTGPQAGGVTTRQITRNNCILWPGQTLTSRFIAANGNNYYSVKPSRSFDVRMKVALAGFRAVTVDRYYSGGTERYNFYNPPPWPRRVAVTISGYRGSTGCFTFVAAP